MNSKIRIFSVVVLAAIHCFAMESLVNTGIHSGFSNHWSSSQEKGGFELTGKFYCHAFQTENSVNSYNNPPAPNLRNHFSGDWATLKTKEQLIESEYSQYSALARNILANYRKSDIIFPFHYFW